MSRLAQALEAHGGELLDQWRERVRQLRVPGYEDRVQLEEHAPAFLRRLTVALRAHASGAQGPPEAGTALAEHEAGAPGFPPGFSLREWVREYGLLREVLLDHLEHTGLQVSLGEVRLLTDFVSTAITEAVEEHARQQEFMREQALLLGPAVLDALATQTLVGVAYLHGPEHVFAMTNPLHRQLLDRDVMGLSVRRAFPDMESQGFRTLMDQVFQTGQPFVAHEVPVRFSTGQSREAREYLCDFTYQPVRGRDGSVEGILALVVEVTERIHLRQAAERLAREERTRSDFEQYLIGIVSHDLRNPLSAILLDLDMLLRRGGLDPRTLRSVTRMQTSTERAVRMVRDLLDFTQARIGGGLKIERTRGGLHALVRGVVEEFQLTHPERALKLEQDGADEGWWDEDRMAQLLGNLLANALKYSPADSLVTVRSQGEGNDFWLEVHNGGEPIAPEALPRLFQPLQRAVEGADHAGRSVGLGLYIVDQIARGHGGDVQVTSSASDGTRFRVRLPREPQGG